MTRLSEGSGSGLKAAAGTLRGGQMALPLLARRTDANPTAGLAVGCQASNHENYDNNDDQMCSCQDV